MLIKLDLFLAASDSNPLGHQVMRTPGIECSVANLNRRYMGFVGCRVSIVSR